tara:strand:- start:625 stop:1056 length:432 start_codon:yes stop_codon:yes gene_type:complete
MSAPPNPQGESVSFHPLRIWLNFQNHHYHELSIIARYMRLYHNPRCSKSRQAVALLTEQGIEFEEYRYLDLGIAQEDLEVLSSLNGIIRTNEKEFKEQKFDLNDVEEIKKALITTPKLLQRPILVKANKAVIGRPPEDLKALL